MIRDHRNYMLQIKAITDKSQLNISNAGNINSGKYRTKLHLKPQFCVPDCDYYKSLAHIKVRLT